MLVLLSFACTDPTPEPDAPPAIVVDLDMEGVSLGEMRGGFGIVNTWPATDDQEPYQELQIVLATYPDPCGALTGFYEDLADAYGADPYPSSSEWDQVLADAGTRFPSEPYDTITLYFGARGDRSVLVDTHPMTLDGDRASLVLEVGRSGFGAYERLHSLEGEATLLALDPVTGEGEVAIARDPASGNDAEGTLGFSFEVPDCPTYRPALAAYEEAQPDGCRGVACG